MIFEAIEGFVDCNSFAEMSKGHYLITGPEVRSSKGYRDGLTCVMVDAKCPDLSSATGSGLQMTGSHLIWGLTYHFSLLEYFI